MSSSIYCHKCAHWLSQKSRSGEKKIGSDSNCSAAYVVSFLLTDIIVFHTLLNNTKIREEAKLLVIFNQVPLSLGCNAIIQTNAGGQDNP